VHFSSPEFFSQIFIAFLKIFYVETWINKVFGATVGGPLHADVVGQGMIVWLGI